MLVLARHAGEKIIIADNITIKVLELTLNQVRLGIEAPFDIKVYREEVYHRILSSLPEKDMTKAS